MENKISYIQKYFQNLIEVSKLDSPSFDYQFNSLNSIFIDINDFINFCKIRSNEGYNKLFIYSIENFEGKDLDGIDCNIIVRYSLLKIYGK